MKTRENYGNCLIFRPASGIVFTGWRNACGNRRLSESCCSSPAVPAASRNEVLVKDEADP